MKQYLDLTFNYKSIIYFPILNIDRFRRNKLYVRSNTTKRTFTHVTKIIVFSESRNMRVAVKSTYDIRGLKCRRVDNVSNLLFADRLETVGWSLSSIWPSFQ